MENASFRALAASCARVRCKTGLWRNSAALVTFLGVVVPALAQTSSLTVNDITVTVNGDVSQSVSALDDGVAVSVNGTEITARSRIVTVDGTDYPVKPLGELVIDVNSAEIVITADDRPVTTIALAEAEVDPQAQADYEQALILLDVESGETDIPGGIALLHSAAEGGYVRAQSDLAFRFYNGEDVAQDFEEARRLARAAGEQGSVSAIRLMAFMMLQGEGGDVDMDRGIAAMEIAAAEGDSYALNELANRSLRGDGLPQDPARAMELYTAAAEAGLPEAQSNLAQQYYYGEIVPQDLAAARLWSERGAAGGNTVAANLYGAMLLDGEGGPADPAAALEIFTQTASSGNARALLWLGVIHGTGNGVPVDLARAAEYYRQAAAGDMVQAMVNLGVLARDSNGQVVSYAEAQDWLGRAAAAGNADATTLLTELATATVAAETANTLNYYYAQDQEVIGPLSIADLRALRDQGTITAQTYVWEDGLANWVLAAELPALAQ